MKANEKQELISRMKLFHDSKTISQTAYEESLQVIEMTDQGEYPFDADKFTSFITHFSMTMQRMENDESISTSDTAEIMNQLEKNEAYGKACQYMEKVEMIIGKSVPNAERQYMLVHLCNLFQNE